MARKLLVVDDLRINRKILARILGDEYDILEAADGREALEALRRGHGEMSAVLLDLSMPVMNGFEVLEAMRADANLSRVPVIVTTGKTEDDSEVRALSLGANDYITKPYNPTIIRQRIRNTINLRETAATINALQRDKLTGLYNREVFFEKAQEMAAGREPGYYTMAAFDLDNFKVINDQYGTEMGDEVLRHVARCVRRWAESVGGVCSRMMADHFAVFYPTARMDDESIRQNHRDAINPPCLGNELRMRIGRYVASDPLLSANAMYDRATLAEASIKGKYDEYAAVYDESMRTRVLREQEIVNEMNGALAAGQFEVWFQPQFNHESGTLIGAEGLVRWRHPQKGLISPGVFIPVFERNGFIYELDKYVWEQVCLRLRGWLDAGRSPLPVSVNISRYDLFRDDIVPFIADMVARHRVPTDLMRFEITESAFAQSADRVIDVVEQLLEKGFVVEIDDFGSGYSSLNTLKDVPASILKLDMRFLESGRNSERGGNILESIVRMAKWLGMPVIAEGVETLEQADYLKSIGCFYIQGYLYARPMPAAEYEAFTGGFGKERGMIRLETVDRLDNNAFWDPGSMETLVFNSYVGGACIFEYSAGRAELLRINDNYVRELDGEMTAARAHALDLREHADERNFALLMDNIENAIRSGGQSSCEVRLHGLGADGASTYIRAKVRVIAKTSGRYLLYASIFNMTALRESERKEREVSAQLATVMDDTPGGFCRVLLTEGGGARLLYVNGGFCKLTNLSRDEVMAFVGPDAPDERGLADAEVVRLARETLAAGGSQFQTRHLLKRRGLAPIWTLVFGRLTRAESGEVTLNAYVTDIEERVRFEERRGELLDNLPCGAALYLYDGESLRAVHLNRRYMELVGRRVDDPSAVSVAGAVHPDDRAGMMAEVRAAVAEGRDILCEIRLRYGVGEGEYRPFRVSGRVTDSGDGAHSIYAAFQRIQR